MLIWKIRGESKGEFSHGATRARTPGLHYGETRARLRERITAALRDQPWQKSWLHLNGSVRLQSGYMNVSNRPKPGVSEIGMTSVSG